MNRLYILFILMPLLASCGIYSKYQRPEVDGVQIVEDLDLPSWRETFSEPQLQALIEKALENNTDLKVASHKVDKADALLRQANMAFLPSASLSAQASGSKTYFGASASWELDIFGRMNNERLAAKASLQEMEAYRQAVQTSLIASVAGSYYSLAGMDRELQISLQTLSNWEKTLSTMEALKSAGRTTQVAILQSQAKKKNLEASLFTIRKNITLAQNALCTLTGIPLSELERSPLGEPSSPAYQEGVRLCAVASRPDVRSAEMALCQAFYATNAARSDFYPAIKISGSSSLDTPADIVGKAVASLAQPLYNRRTLTTALEVARAEQDAALDEFRQTLLEAVQEVSDGLCECRSATDRLEIDRQRVETLQQAVDKIQLLMQYSTTNYLEVLTAQQSLLDAQLDVVNDIVTLRKAQISVYHSLGGGVE